MTKTVLSAVLSYTVVNEIMEYHLVFIAVELELLQTHQCMNLCTLKKMKVSKKTVKKTL